MLDSYVGYILSLGVIRTWLTLVIIAQVSVAALIVHNYFCNSNVYRCSHALLGYGAVLHNHVSQLVVSYSRNLHRTCFKNIRHSEFQFKY